MGIAIFFFRLFSVSLFYWNTRTYPLPQFAFGLEIFLDETDFILSIKDEYFESQGKQTDVDIKSIAARR